MELTDPQMDHSVTLLNHVRRVTRPVTMVCDGIKHSFSSVSHTSQFHGLLLTLTAYKWTHQGQGPFGSFSTLLTT